MMHFPTKFLSFLNIRYTLIVRSKPIIDIIVTVHRRYGWLESTLVAYAFHLPMVCPVLGAKQLWGTI